MAKNSAQRRLSFDWGHFVEAKHLFRVYDTGMRTEAGSGKNWIYFPGKMDAAKAVMTCLEVLEKELSLALPKSGFITGYSLRISCCSYLFANNVSGERIKVYMGWAIDSSEWFDTYVREVRNGPVVRKFWGSLIPNL